MEIVIVAGGLGTRFKELSVFPKVLLPTCVENSILNQYLDTFEGLRINLIINKKFAPMVENYCEVNKLYNVNIIPTTNANGSYNTIKSCETKLPKKEVLFVWSDLILFEDITKLIDIPTSNYIFTYGKDYRYKFEGGKVVNCSDTYDGNIPGLYYVSDLSKVLKTPLDAKDNYDLVEELANVKCNEVRLQNLFELKDLETYVKWIEVGKEAEMADSGMKTRFFNSLEIDTETTPVSLVKTAIDESYVPLIKKEFNWYRTVIDDTTKSVFPKIWPDMESHNSFRMEYLKNGWVPLHKFLKNETFDFNVKIVYENINNNILKLSKKTKKVPLMDFIKDFEKEIYYKIFDRCEKIKDMLVSYNKEELEYLLLGARKKLLGKYARALATEVEMPICHGDLNGSNVLVNTKTLEVKFIDPRGYFGNTEIYGWQDYEYAKLLYCLYGYDDFNNLPQIYSIDEPKKLKWFELTKNGYIPFLDNDDYHTIVAVIWVALAGYISQDIMKANIAYEYGIKLLREFVING